MLLAAKRNCRKIRGLQVALDTFHRVIVEAEQRAELPEDILLIAEIASKATGLRPSQINISNQVGK